MLQSPQTMINNNAYFAIIWMVLPVMAIAQIENDTLGTQTVNIEKTFTPTVGEARKINSTPESTDPNSVKKIETKYEVQSIPVASVFNPLKPNARQIKMIKSEKFFANQLMLMGGNYGTILAEFSAAFDLGVNQKLTTLLDHHSSQGGISKNTIDDDFNRSNLGLTFSNITRNNDWNIRASAGFNQYQWYGVPQNLWNQEQLNNISDPHQWLTYDFGSTLKPDSEWLGEMQIEMNGLSDNFENTEIIASASLVSLLPFMDDTFESTFAAKYRSNETGLESEGTLDNLLFSWAPKFKIHTGDLSLDIGLIGFYQITDDPNASDFFVVPDAHLAYNLEDLVVSFDATGGIRQHSYRNFLDTNSFFSPNNDILSEEIPYRFSIGVEAQVAPDFSIDVDLSYENANQKPMMVLNSITDDLSQDYSFGNSFGLLFDSIKSTSVGAGFIYTGLEKTTIHIRGQYNNFSTDVIEFFYNRSNLEASLFIHSSLSEHWSLDLFGKLYGLRKDRFLSLNTILGLVDESINISAFADLNLATNYRLSDHWTAEVRVNNILNADQPRWGYFPVQGIQGLAGLRYNFDW